MISRKNILVHIIPALLIMSSDSFSQDSTETPRDGASSFGEDIFHQTDPELLALRTQRISELVAVATDDELLRDIEDEKLAKANRARVVSAILELGALRAHEAAAVLAEKLDFHVSKDGIVESREVPPPEKVYPAVKALIQIREPSLPAIANAVAARERPERFRLNAAYTIMKITGGNEQARAAIVQFAIEEVGARRARLKDLATVIPIVVDKNPNAITPRWETPKELREDE